ncbi:hypothetical protein JCM5353_005417 [Sporobolomyces roseus]
MTTDWVKLKQKRATKSAIPPVATSSDSVAPSLDQESESQPPTRDVAASTSSKPLDFSHPDLPPCLSVHSIPGKGRGLTANESFAPGSTILSTSPLISVLDNRNLPVRCSACYRLSEDSASQKVLQQCSLCHIVQYCSASCQTQDWKLHKMECKALRTMASNAKGKGKGRETFVPDTSVRALGRLLWLSEVEGGSLWKQIASLESHRSRLTQEEQEQFFQLSMAIAAYVGQPTVLKSCNGSSELLDLLSRFSSNSFSLTSPTDLTNIGVTLSPLTALLNHSCPPNAVVVFPSFPTSTDRKTMKVIAIRPIQKGEEVTISYVDTAGLKSMRQKELRERYKFECGCEECEGKEERVDPREAFECPEKGCDGLLALRAGGGESICSICRKHIEVPDMTAALEAAKTAYEDAEKDQHSDPAVARISLSNAISSLTSISPRLSPSAYPLSQALQLSTTLHLSSSSFALASQSAQSAWRGASLLYPYGHPVRSISSTTIARLASIAPSDPSPEEDLRYWTNLKERSLGLRLMVEALKECEVGFGKKEGGGEVGRKLRALVRDQEEGMEMGRRVMSEGR